MITQKSFLISAIIVLIISLLFTTSLANDDNNISKTGARVEIVATDAQNISAAGARVNVKGTVTEDTWLAGALIEVDLKSSGNLYAAGADITLNGKIHGNAKLAGARVSINSEIVGQLDAAAAEITVSKNSIMGPSSTLTAALIEFNGLAQDNLEINADEVIFRGEVNGIAIVEGRSIKLENNAVINGNLVIRSVEAPQVSELAKISGETTFETLTEDEYRTSQQEDEGFLSNFSGKIRMGTSAFLLGLVLILFTRNATDQMTGLLRAHPAKSILWGLGILFGLPIIILICLVSVVGIPVGLTSLFTIPFLLFLGFTAAILAFGDYLLMKSGKQRGLKQRILFLVISVFIYYLVRLIPVLGGITVFFAMLFGLGAMAVTIGNRIKGEEILPHNTVSL